VALTAYVLAAPTINLFLKSGVPLAPLHNIHPVGIAAEEPDQTIIAPTGNAVVSVVLSVNNTPEVLIVVGIFKYYSLSIKVS
jgi:hypothetical protein